MPASLVPAGRSNRPIIVLQSRAITELRNAAEVLSGPADFENLPQLESSGRIPRLTMLRAQIEWIRQELLDYDPGIALIGGIEPENFPVELRKAGFGIISALLGPIIKSRFKYIRSFHTDGPLYLPLPPRYLGWCILGESRESLRFETISAQALAQSMEKYAPRLAAVLHQPFPFDSGEEFQADQRIAANAPLHSYPTTAGISGQRDGAGAGQSAVPILDTGAAGAVIRFDRQYLERGFRSLGIDSHRFEAATNLFTVLDTMSDPVPVTVGRGEMLFINNHMLLHSRDPVTREAKSSIHKNNVDCPEALDPVDAVCRSWIGSR